MPASVTLEKDRLLISGDLNFVSVVPLLHASLPLLEKGVKQIDLQQVTSVNSAGLALLVEWLRWAGQKNQTLSFKNIPTELLSIAAVCGLNTVLRDG